MKTEDGFYLVVDGKKYGPFLEKHRHSFVDLENKKGIEFVHARLTEGWIEPPPKKKRRRPDKSTPLLEDTDFIPVHKAWYPSW